MTATHITALLLLTGSAETGPASLTLQALSKQTHPIDHVDAIVCGAPSADLRELLDAMRQGGLNITDRTVSSTLSLGGILRRHMAGTGSGGSADTDSDHRLDGASDRPTDLASDSEADPQTEQFLWILDDQAAPAPDCLEHLVAAVRTHDDVAVLGCKQLLPLGDMRGPEHSDGVSMNHTAVTSQDELSDKPDYDSPESDQKTPIRDASSARHLVEVGFTVTPGGRRVTGIDPGEIDQGQADWRSDVLAVNPQGLLLRTPIAARLGGIDPAFDAQWGVADLCRRVWRAGYRVQVIPKARVIAGGSPREASWRVYRRGQVLAQLTRFPLIVALGILLLLPFVTVVRLVSAIVVHTPGRLIQDPAAIAGVYRRAPGVLLRSQRTRTRRPVPRKNLRHLYVSFSRALRDRCDDAVAGMVPTDAARRPDITVGIGGSIHDRSGAGYGSHAVIGLVLTAVSALGAGFLLHPLLRSGHFSGPGLIAWPEDPTASWQAGTSSWIPAALGHRGPADPLLRLISHLPVSGEVAMTVLFVGAIPLSALTAWWAFGLLTRSAPVRLVLALGWALAPPLLGALRDGSWPLLLVQIALPLVLLGIGRAIGIGGPTRPPLAAAAAGAGLALLPVAAVSPAAGVLVVCALIPIACFVPGRRMRLLWTAIPTLALLAPIAPYALRDPRILLATSGVPSQNLHGGVWDLLAGWPHGPLNADSLERIFGPAAAVISPWLVLFMLAPWVLLAAIAIFLPSRAGTLARLCVLGAGIAMALAVLSRHTAVAIIDGATRTGDGAVPVACAVLALLAAAACALDTLAAPGPRRSRVVWRRIAAVVMTVNLVTVIALTFMCLPPQLGIQRTGGLTAQAAESATHPSSDTAQPESAAPDYLPAAAADQGLSSRQARTLVFTSGSDNRFHARLIRGDGKDLTRSSVIAEARGIIGSRLDVSPMPLDAADNALGHAAATLLSDGHDPTRALQTLAVAYVYVPGHADDQAGARLRALLDSSDVLEQVTRTEQGSLWRVLAPSSRAMLIAGSPDSMDSLQGRPLSITALPSEIIRVRTHVDAAEHPRTLVLSERHDGQWQAWLGGVELVPAVVDGWAEGFAIPAGASGELIVDHSGQVPMWILGWVQDAIWLLAILAALPWRRRSVRLRELAVAARHSQAHGNTPQPDTESETESREEPDKPVIRDADQLGDGPRSSSGTDQLAQSGEVEPARPGAPDQHRAEDS
ncbi:glycosyltransferase family 2 protein [Devriesea agamarum]|uniref:hypothetical protein n=1 Tax=Devriesea agamarum TaxID=472569 RepID=UPI00071E5205|nr:hypothetical protein [Devriesea agamarum]